MLSFLRSTFRHDGRRARLLPPPPRVLTDDDDVPPFLRREAPGPAAATRREPPAPPVFDPIAEIRSLLRRMTYGQFMDCSRSLGVEPQALHAFAKVHS